MNTLVSSIVDDLKVELQETDDRFNEDLLIVKVESAYREVKKARNYPLTYTEQMIEADMDKYYSNIRNLALYDYNTIGGEFQKSSSEGGEQRAYIDRNKMLVGVIPLARC